MCELDNHRDIEKKAEHFQNVEHQKNVTYTKGGSRHSARGPYYVADPQTFIRLGGEEI